MAARESNLSAASPKAENPKITDMSFIDKITHVGIGLSEEEKKKVLSKPYKVGQIRSKDLDTVITIFGAETFDFSKKQSKHERSVPSTPGDPSEAERAAANAAATAAAATAAAAATNEDEPNPNNAFDTTSNIYGNETNLKTHPAHIQTSTDFDKQYLGWMTGNDEDAKKIKNTMKSLFRFIFGTQRISDVTATNKQKKYRIAYTSLTPKDKIPCHGSGYWLDFKKSLEFRREAANKEMHAAKDIFGENNFYVEKKKGLFMGLRDLINTLELTNAACMAYAYDPGQHDGDLSIINDAEYLRLLSVFLKFVKDKKSGRNVIEFEDMRKALSVQKPAKSGSVLADYLGTGGGASQAAADAASAAAAAAAATGAAGAAAPELSTLPPVVPDASTLPTGEFDATESNVNLNALTAAPTAEVTPAPAPPTAEPAPTTAPTPTPIPTPLPTPIPNPNAMTAADKSLPPPTTPREAYEQLKSVLNWEVLHAKAEKQIETLKEIVKEVVVKNEKIDNSDEIIDSLLNFLNLSYDLYTMRTQVDALDKEQSLQALQRNREQSLQALQRNRDQIRAEFQGALDAKTAEISQLEDIIFSLTQLMEKKEEFNSLRAIFEQLAQAKIISERLAGIPANSSLVGISPIVNQAIHATRQIQTGLEEKVASLTQDLGASENLVEELNQTIDGLGKIIIEAETLSKAKESADEIRSRLNANYQKKAAIEGIAAYLDTIRAFMNPNDKQQNETIDESLEIITKNIQTLKDKLAECYETGQKKTNSIGILQERIKQLSDESEERIATTQREAQSSVAEAAERLESESAAVRAAAQAEIAAITAESERIARQAAESLAGASANSAALSEQLAALKSAIDARESAAAAAVAEARAAVDAAGASAAEQARAQAAADALIDEKNTLIASAAVTQATNAALLAQLAELQAVAAEASAAATAATDATAAAKAEAAAQIKRIRTIFEKEAAQAVAKHKVELRKQKEASNAAAATKAAEAAASAAYTASIEMAKTAAEAATAALEEELSATRATAAQATANAAEARATAAQANANRGRALNAQVAAMQRAANAEEALSRRAPTGLHAARAQSLDRDTQPPLGWQESLRKYPRPPAKAKPWRGGGATFANTLNTLLHLDVASNNTNHKEIMQKMHTNVDELGQRGLVEGALDEIIDAANEHNVTNSMNFERVSTNQEFGKRLAELYDTLDEKDKKAVAAITAPLTYRAEAPEEFQGILGSAPYIISGSEGSLKGVDVDEIEATEEEKKAIQGVPLGFILLLKLASQRGGGLFGYDEEGDEDEEDDDENDDANDEEEENEDDEEEDEDEGDANANTP